MKNDNCIVIQGWMLNELHLKGNELIAYAMIYMVSQDGESEFSGSINYISDTLGVTPANAHSILQRLADKGLIRKRTDVTDKGKRCRYSVVRDIIETIIPPIIETIKRGITETIKRGAETANGSIDNIDIIVVDNKDNYNINIDNNNNNNNNNNNVNDKDITVSELKSNMSWKEAICMKHHVSLDAMDGYIDEFELSNRCRGSETHATRQQLMSHFDSWLAIHLKAGKRQDARTRKEEDDERALNSIMEYRRKREARNNNNNDNNTKNT